MRRMAGFTLIEVVVALALAAGSIGALLTVFDDAAFRTDRAVLSRLALLQAQSALDAAASGPMTPGWRVDGASAGLIWEAQVSEDGDSTPPLRPQPPMCCTPRLFFPSMQWGYTWRLSMESR